MDAQLKKGVVELCLLACVAQKDQYGYDVIKRMQEHFPEMNESSFYVILRRLHRDGALEQYPGETSGGPPRKYYRVTEQGREQLKRQMADWNALVAVVGELSGGADAAKKDGA